ncbi:conserved hypothetical protein [sediment metagenome]|uniref:Uncharacterized protein n=1 Tax=sediment metagenome TaxID=749907 RepID=D9PM64_9ZZZZ
MEIRKAILSFSQSEKIKSGIIWVSNAIGMLSGVPDFDRKSGEKVISLLVQMISQEARLAESVSGDPIWGEIDPHFEKTLLMINSGVSQEAALHLSKALSIVTNIGQRSMTVLKEKGFL